MTLHEEKAMDLFYSGCNCSQAVLAAFSDLTGLDDTTALRISSSFGGGMGRMREVCGAVSGMFMVLGLLYGYEKDIGGAKKLHYERVRDIAERFRREHGSIICRELLAGVFVTSGGEPEERTPEFYKKRPCAKYIGDCARIIDEYIKENSLD